MMTVTVRIRIPANPLQNLTGLKQLDVTYAIKLVILLLTALLNTNVRSLGPPLHLLSCLLLNPLQPQPKILTHPFPLHSLHLQSHTLLGLLMFILHMLLPLPTTEPL